MTDRQPREQAVERPRLARLDRLHQVVGRLLPHPVELGERGRVEPVEVGQRLDQPLVHELVDQLLAQAVDVHCVAVGVPADPLLELLGTLAGGFVQ